MARTRVIETMPPTASGRVARADTALPPVSAEHDLHFHALLTPNRSLSGQGFRTVMSIVVSVNVINALIYFFAGAWPVMFFCGIDILIVWLAFTLSYRQGRQHERIMLTEDALWISRVLPSGHETRWRLDPYWMRIELERPVEHETQLRLRQNARTLVVGSFLAPKEREEVADALLSAIARWKTRGQ